MKLAVDPNMIRFTPLAELPGAVAELGYRYIELSPRDDFLPFFVHPRTGREQIATFRRELAAAEVKIASVLPLSKWAGPDEDARQAAVRYWKRAIQVTAELGCTQMNSEFNGRPEATEASEAQFWRSLEELLPVFEREGVKLALEPHPDDFIEDGCAAVDLIRGIDSDLVHQHLDVGQGEVDWDVFFATLAEVGFDGIATVCVFAWEDRARESLVANRERVESYATEHGLAL